MAENERVRIDSSSIPQLGPRSVSISGLTEADQHAIQAMLAGCCWIRINEQGRLERQERFLELPAPEPDPQLHLHWQGTPKLHHHLFDSQSSTFGASILITSLCGYHYSVANYEREKAKLESYGFECLRSKRGKDGKFWELWLLPGLYAADGELKEHLQIHGAKRKPGELKVAISFLCSRVLFGAMDVTVQRAAMMID